jgi:hypothetical protein
MGIGIDGRHGSPPQRVGAAHFLTQGNSNGVRPSNTMTPDRETPDKTEAIIVKFPLNAVEK